MADITLKELVEAGVHFGSKTSRWNPKMKPYIHSKKSGIHIIDLRETLKGIIRASIFLNKVAASGKKILFVGTKRQAAEIIRQEAGDANSYFVVHRWLGGTLTNMDTMRKRVTRLEELEGLDKSGAIDNFSKKMISSLTREKKKIFRNFEGIRDMKEAPGAIVIVDPSQEDIAVAESMKLGIPLIGIVDTDSDPDPIDFIIPANDDSQRSIQLILNKLGAAIKDGAKKASNKSAIKARAAGKSEEKGMEVPSNLSKMGAFTMPDDAE